MGNGGWQMADGGWEMADGRWQMADGRWQMADGGWRMADGGWRMADGGWQMADGGWRVENAVTDRAGQVSGCQKVGASSRLHPFLPFAFCLFLYLGARKWVAPSAHFGCHPETSVIEACVLLRVAELLSRSGICCCGQIRARLRGQVQAWT